MECPRVVVWQAAARLRNSNYQYCTAVLPKIYHAYRISAKPAAAAPHIAHAPHGQRSLQLNLLLNLHLNLRHILFLRA